MTSGRTTAWVLSLATCVTLAACGKKGPPVAPRVRIPAAVETLTTTRLGNDVYISLTVPATNIDMSVPVDISRVDVYAYTGRVAPSRARFPDLATVVASIPVAPPPKPGEAPSVSPDLSAGALPKTSVTVLDTLTADEFEQGKVEVEPLGRGSVAVPPVAAQAPSVMRRFYIAVPFSIRGRPGPSAMQAEVVLSALPDPPTEIRATYDASRILLAWEPSGGLIGFLLDRMLSPEQPPFVATTQPVAPETAQTAAAVSVPAGPTTYNVYREVSPDPLELRVARSTPAWTAVVPAPVNSAPLTTTSGTDDVVPGRQHCYTVRAQRGMVLSAPSSRTCVTPFDIFPPAAPAGLAAVPSEGGISLIWEPNSEPDLGGYVVLRREPGDATLRQLTTTPVADTRYRDTDVQPGRRYLYSVVAVDTQVPLPNVSAESERVEEAAR
jgi:predicted small lipoprotein YifL